MAKPLFVPLDELYCIGILTNISRSRYSPEYEFSNPQNCESSENWDAFTDAYSAGYTRSERDQRPPGQGGGQYDPWDHAFRNNQAKRMWEMAMEMEYGDKTPFFNRVRTLVQNLSP